MAKQPHSRTVNTRPPASQAANRRTNGKTPARKAPVTELEIRIDPTKITFGDLEMSLQYKDGKIPLEELLPFLNRVVIGGVKNVPVTAMPDIMDALNATFENMGDQKNSRKG